MEEKTKFKAHTVIGVIAVVFIYVLSMVGAYATDPELFSRQLFYFSLTTFLLLGIIVFFDIAEKGKIDFKFLAVDPPVILATIIGMITVVALVFMSTLKLHLIQQIPAMITALPTAEMTIYHLFYVGASEGILQYFFIRAFAIKSMKLGLIGAVIVAAVALTGLHWYAYGLSATMLWIFMMFIILGVLSLLPKTLGSEVEISAFVIIVCHAVNNIAVPVAGTLLQVI